MGYLSGVIFSTKVFILVSRDESRKALLRVYWEVNVCIGDKPAPILPKLYKVLRLYLTPTL